jgi:hypothetical protein
MIIMLRRLARSFFFISLALTASCAFALFMVYRKPLLNLAEANINNNDNMKTPNIILPVVADSSKLFTVEQVLLKNWSADAGMSIPVKDLKGKFLIRKGQTIPSDYSIASRAESKVLYSTDSSSDFTRSTLMKDSSQKALGLSQTVPWSQWYHKI